MFRHLLKIALTKRCQLGFCGIKELHLKARLSVKEKTLPMESKHLDKINEILDKYDKEQEEKLLTILNSSNLNQFLSYAISKGRANKLIGWRTRNGILKDLNDIFSIEGFGVKVVAKFFNSLLGEPKTNELNLGKSKTKTALFVIPSLDLQQRLEIKSCVSVHIGVNSITWARLDCPGTDVNAPCLLTHWEHHEISEKKLHINELIERCLYIHHMIPTADCYIFESPQMAQVNNNPGSVDQQNINIQKAQMIAIMGYALAFRKNGFNDATGNETDKSLRSPQVFYVKRFLCARLFNHLVGTEKVSSESTILNMMRTYYNTNEDNKLDENNILLSHHESALDEDQPLNNNNTSLSSSVQFPMKFRQMFSTSPPHYREFLSQTLLLNLTFVRLVLLQDEESIAKVSRSNKQNQVA